MNCFKCGWCLSQPGKIFSPIKIRYLINSSKNILMKNGYDDKWIPFNKRMILNSSIFNYTHNFKYGLYCDWCGTYYITFPQSIFNRKNITNAPFINKEDRVIYKGKNK